MRWKNTFNCNAYVSIYGKNSILRIDLNVVHLRITRYDHPLTSGASYTDGHEGRIA